MRFNCLPFYHGFRCLRASLRPALLSVAVTSVFAVDESDFSQPVRILPLGDSMTQAWADTSYRYPLWERLLDHGVDVEFLGTLSDTDELTSLARPPEYLGRAYDGDHEGHWGWTADEVLYSLDNWLDQYETPDIALIHLGTNDSFRGQDNAQTRREIAQIIDRLQERNPAMLIVVAKIFPGFWADVTPLNDEIAKLAGPNVLIGDCYTGIDIATDTVDGAHPNPSGGEKMAAAWWAVLQPHLEPWRQTYARWGEGHGLEGEPTDDSDGDGWINFFEFGTRADPLDPASMPRLKWSAQGWVLPEVDPLRAGNRVIRQAAPSPAGPFTFSPPVADGDFLIVRWIYQP